MGTSVSIIHQDEGEQAVFLESVLTYWGYSPKVYTSWEDIAVQDVLVSLQALPEEAGVLSTVPANATCCVVEPRNEPQADTFSLPEKAQLLDVDYYIFRSIPECIAFLLSPDAHSAYTQPKKTRYFLSCALIYQLQGLHHKIQRLQSAFQADDEAAIAKSIQGITLPQPIKKQVADAILENTALESANLNFDQIIQAYRQALAVDPDRTELLQKWSKELIKQDQYREGEEIQAQLDFKLKIKTSRYGVQIDRGIYYRSQKDYKEAKAVLHDVISDLEADQEKHPGYFISSLSRVYHVIGILYLEQDYGSPERDREYRDYEQAHHFLTKAFQLRLDILESSPANSEAKNAACQEYVSSANALVNLYQEADESRFPALKDPAKAETYATQAIDAIKQLFQPNKDIYRIHLETIKKLKGILDENDDRVTALENTQRQLNRLIENSSDICVFISFSSQDREVKEKIKDFLVQSGIKVTDYENSMKLGEEIKDFIERAIDENDFTLNLISKNSLLSAWVAEELLQNSDYHNIKGKKYIPCLIDETLFDDNFVNDARESVGNDIQELRTQMIAQLEQEEPIDHLFSQFKLKEQLHMHIAPLITKLRSIGCPNLTPDSFDGEIDKLADKIIEEGNALIN